MINNVTLMGRLTADPELKTTTSGISVTRFTIAVDRPYVRAGEERQADFIRIIAWRQQAEFVCRFFKKGSMIALTGSIQTGSYDDKNGNKVFTTDVVCDRASFCGSKSETGTGGPASDSAAAPAYRNAKAADFEEIPDEEELPF